MPEVGRGARTSVRRWSYKTGKGRTGEAGGRAADVPEAVSTRIPLPRCPSKGCATGGRRAGPASRWTGYAVVPTAEPLLAVRLLSAFSPVNSGPHWPVAGQVPEPHHPVMAAGGQ